MLNEDQVEAAIQLHELRPLTIPGTQAIINDAERYAWYQAVGQVMAEFDVYHPDDVERFCDIAGVAD